MRTAAINLRVLPAQRDLIDHAAALLGKSRSEFMLDTVCHHAQNVILDRTLFQLNQQSFEEFVQLLEQPVSDNPQLNQLLATPNPWDKP